MSAGMRAVRIREFGNLATAGVVDGDAPVPGAGEVVIDVEAVPVNFVDLVTMRGAYQFRPALPYTPGKGPAGYVSAVGPGIEHLKVGDRVLGMAEYGGYAEKCVVRGDQAYLLPEDLGFVDAAAMSLSFDTAWMGLVERGRLAPGESVLVLGASGAVGGAAVQLAKALGAGTVLAGISDPSRFQQVANFGADDYVLQSGPNLRDTLRDRVMELTDGRGVDVVIDAIGGDAFDGAVRAVAWRGRLVIVGFAAGRIPTLKMNYPMLKNIEVSGLQISDYRKRAPELMRECFDSIFGLYSKGLLTPPRSETFGLDDWRRAVEALASKSTRARLVLTP
ncbi:NADPH:quinone oxidoreductase family protein [Arthrobacter sp. NPDC057013]|uniref:NADPH:quinone oxidoreductase family protein n=1 Tax=Arthrobacter sp. NPDC057013 TaxID=3345999 RepID=UPI003643575C